MSPRRLFFIMLVAVGVNSLTSLPADEPNIKSDSKDDSKLIRGIWNVVELHQVNHESTKEEREFLKSGGFKMLITADKLVCVPDKSEIQYRLDVTKKPKVMEWLADGRVVARAIYELNGDDLKFCLGRKPERGEPEPPAVFDIKKAKPGTFPTLWILKRKPGKGTETK